MSRLILAADIGGTHSRLAIFDIDRDPSAPPLRQSEYDSLKVTDFGDLVREFLSAGNERLVTAVLGAAGPVIGRSIRITNLRWGINAEAVSSVLGGIPVRLLNDLEAMAYGVLWLREANLTCIHEGRRRHGNRAVIAAGTGLGQAILFWDGVGYHPCATEGGHADFAPRDAVERQFAEFLLQRHPRSSWERVLSGPGLENLFHFVADELHVAIAEAVRDRLSAGENPGAVIGEAGLDGSCAASRRAVEMFVSLYGAQAGNLALTTMAKGGVYIGGGMAVKLLAKMNSRIFTDAFLAKQPFQPLMEEIAVFVITDPHVNLFGAAHVAALDAEGKGPPAV